MPLSNGFIVGEGVFAEITARQDKATSNEKYFADHLSLTFGEKFVYIYNEEAKNRLGQWGDTVALPKA